MNFVQNVQQHVDAAYPIILVRTHEEDRAIADLRRVEGVKAVYEWSLGTGWRTGGALAAKTPTQLDAVAAIEKLLPESLYVLKDFHPFVGAAPVCRAIRDALPALKASRRVIVLLGPVPTVPVELEREVAVVDYALPDRAELGAVFDKVVADAAKAGGGAPEVADRAAVVEALRSLTAAEAESAASLALIRHDRFDASAVRTIRTEKAAVIRRSGLVTWVEPSVTVDDVGGLERLKAYLRRIAPVFHRRDDALAYGLLPEDFPRSLALVGMPGCGKSMVAEAAGLLLGIPCVRTDFGRIFATGGGRVGAAEAAIEARNQLVEAQDPVQDWWDEAEKGLAGAGGASTANPWEARVGGTILTWMESYRATVFVTATINRHEILPPEMLSRFQKVFFVGFPSFDEREQIARLHLAKRRIERAGEVAVAVADATPGYNGREIRNAIQAAMQAAFAGGRPCGVDDVLAAAQAITPLSVARATELDAIRHWADENQVESASGPADDVPTPAAQARRVRRRS